MRPVFVRSLRVVGLAGLAAVSLAGALQAQAVVQGRVTDSTGAPVAGAVVAVERTTLRAGTTQEGRYVLRGVPAGTVALRIRAIGFTPATAELTVPASGTVDHDIILARTPVELAPIDVVVGSRARHTAAEELAVPVDVYTAEDLQRQGTTETGAILQAVSPSVNFPRQSVTDATDIVRPFTLRGLSPDHTLVLVNGWRRHQTAVLNTFAYGTGAGSSGVDLNALPSSAIDRVEVLRDGASAQYGSDAIAGVVNLVIKDGAFAPYLTMDAGRYITDDFPDDGTTVTVNGGWGLRLGRGSLGLFAEYRDREPTNRAWADPFDASVTGTPDSVSDDGQVITKRNPVPQPNHHWGDGRAKDLMTFANFRMPLNPAGSSEVYVFGGYSFRQGTGNGYRRYADDSRNWPTIYPLGFLPEFAPDVNDYSVAGGWRGSAAGWALDFGASFGHSDFEYNLTNTLNASLGPCLDVACAPGPDGIFGNGDDPGIPNQTDFFAGRLLRNEFLAGVNLARAVTVGLPAPLNVAVGAAYRRERYKITPGERASWIDGGNPDQFGDDAPGGSQVFPGFAPTDASNDHRSNVGVYADLETNLSPRLLANLAGRFESYSDFGERLTGKLALRYQPSPQVTLRGSASTGFRAPGLSQIHFSKVSSNFIFDTALGRPVQVDVGNFPVNHPASRLLGARKLQEETSVNLSAGVVVTPVPSLTIGVDYFRITIDDRILLGATFDDDTTLAILQAAGFDNIGGVQYFTNGLDTRTQGVDVTANLRVPVGASGTLDLNGNFNYTKNEITRVDPLPAVLANSDEEGLLDVVTRVGIEEERPDWRTTITATYSRARFRTLGRLSYFGGFASAQPGYCDACRETYGGKGLVDAEVGYRFTDVNLSIGVRNIFDTYPDQASDTNSFGIFPWAAASPFGYNGRFVYTRAEVVLGW